MYEDIVIPTDIFEALSSSSNMALSNDDVEQLCQEVEICFNYGKINTRLVDLDDGQVIEYFKRDKSIAALVGDLPRQFPFPRQRSDEYEGWRTKLFAFVEGLSPEHPLWSKQKKRNIKRIVTI